MHVDKVMKRPEETFPRFCGELCPLAKEGNDMI